MILDGPGEHRGQDDRYCEADADLASALRPQARRKGFDDKDKGQQEDERLQGPSRRPIPLQEIQRGTSRTATETFIAQPASRTKVGQLPSPARDAVAVVSKQLSRGGCHSQQEEGEEPHRELVGKATQGLSLVV